MLLAGDYIFCQTGEILEEQTKDEVLYRKIKSLPLCAALPCQVVHVLNSAHSRPSVTPVGGTVSLAIALARRATALVQQTVTCVSVETLLYMRSVPWLTAHWDNTMMVRGSVRLCMKYPHFRI